MSRKPRKPTKIDLQAMAAPKRNWTAAEDDVLFDWYGLEKPAALQRRILRETGSPRSIAAIIVRAGALNLDHRTASGYLTVKEAAAELGISVHVIHHRVRTGSIKYKGRGKAGLLSDETMEQLRKEFPPAPAKSMSKTQAMRALGYSETHFTRLLVAGVIRGVRRGERWYVDAEHVEQLVAEFKREGVTRREWGDLPHLEAERAKARAYSIGKRRQRRHEDRAIRYYTQSEARRVLGIGRDEMRRLLEAGAVRGKRENGLWLAERAHVDELAQQKREVGA